MSGLNEYINIAYIDWCPSRQFVSSESCVNNIVNASILFHILLWKFVCSSVFQRFHRSNIDLNYSRKEEDWCRILLSKSDGSGRAPTVYISH